MSLIQPRSLVRALFPMLLAAVLVNRYVRQRAFGGRE